MKQPWMREYNELAKVVNEIIDKLEEKVEIVPMTLSLKVKDYEFFKWTPPSLPYEAHYTISNYEDYQKLLEKYNLDSRDVKAYKEILDKGRVLSLTINVEEELTEKDIKQEVAINKIKTIDMKELWDVWNLLQGMWVKQIKVKKEKEKKETKTKKKNKWWNINLNK